MGSNGENLSPNSFCRKWKVLQEVRKDEDDESESVLIKEQQENDQGFDGDCYTLELKDPLVGPALKNLTWSEDSKLISHNPDPEDSDQSRTCISYWRHAYDDIIFSLTVDGSGSPELLFSAAAKYKDPVIHPLVNKEITGKIWTITFGRGIPRAQNSVRAKEFDEDHYKAFGGVGSKLMMLARSGFGIVDGSRFLMENGVVLEVFSKVCNRWIPYDIVVYDDETKTFNSVFGFRSVAPWAVPDLEKRYLIATFNSWFLKNASWRNVIYDLYKKFIKRCSHQLGMHMPHEYQYLDSVGSDQDVGVWVGESDY